MAEIIIIIIFIAILTVMAIGAYKSENNFCQHEFWHEGKCKCCGKTYDEL